MTKKIYSINCNAMHWWIIITGIIRRGHFSQKQVFLQTKGMISTATSHGNFRRQRVQRPAWFLALCTEEEWKGGMVGGAQWCGLRPLEAMLPQSSPDGGRRWWCLGWTFQSHLWFSGGFVLCPNKSWKPRFGSCCTSCLSLVDSWQGRSVGGI